MRTWRRITFSIGSLDPDPFVIALHEMGTLGVESRGSHLIAWFDPGRQPPDLAQRIRALGGGGDTGKILEAADVADERWHERWMQRQIPFPCGARFLIVPGEFPPEDPAPGRLVLRVPPGRAFGTGEHATTRQCLEMIDRWVGAGTSILDLGTGTGILAIAAWLMGARPVVAIDADAEAVRVARRNAVLSGAAGIRLAACAVETLNTVKSRGRFASIVANLDAPTLHRALPVLAALEPEQAVLSGLLEDDADAIASRARSIGFEVVARSVESEWVALMIAPRP